MAGFQLREHSSSSQSEDDYGKWHYERQICGIRNELLEEQRRLGLKAFVDEGKNQALCKFQEALHQLYPSLKESGTHSEYVARKKDDETKAIESAQSIMPFEYEAPIQRQEYRKSHRAERDIVLPDGKYKKCGEKQRYFSTDADQFTSHTARKCRTEHGTKSQFFSLLHKFDDLHEKLWSLQTVLSQLKDNRQVVGVKIMELNKNIGLLEEQKKVLDATLIEYNEKEKNILTEAKQFLSEMERLKYELRKCRNSEYIHDEASQSRKNSQLNKEKNIVTSISREYALEIKLLRDIHKEELQLYKLQLAQAAQQISHLEVQLKILNAKQKVTSSNKQDGSKHEKRDCITRESNLVNDGTGHVKHVTYVDECKKFHHIHNNENEYTFGNTSSSYENHVSGDVIGKPLQLESALRSLILNHFDSFKREMLNVIGEKVKQNAFSVSDRLTLDHNLKEVKSEDEISDVEEDSTPSKKGNALDCGTGMAFNFYYGYLKLVLPSGISAHGIKGRILQYTKDERLSDNAFPVKKLIILIPQNTYTPTSLEELSTDGDGTKRWIECVKPLQPEIIERNGWKRDFHHSVYKIKDPDSESRPNKYVVAEFATPVKVFSDIIHKCPVPKISEAFKVYQQKIISSFHKSLLERIGKNNDGCKDLCEIIYYPDTDKNGKRVNIGRVILERIHLKHASIAH